MSTNTHCLFLRHESGKLTRLAGRNLNSLLRALRAGGGGELITRYLLSGYTETLGGLPLDTEDTDALVAEAEGRFTA
jgi:hypothetical protein